MKRVVSSGTPEVNDYPFTTRGVTIGHIVDRARDLRFQVVDKSLCIEIPKWVLLHPFMSGDGYTWTTRSRRALEK
jgi:hypothetical protein